jgi:hypothetical protein
MMKTHRYTAVLSLALVFLFAGCYSSTIVSGALPYDVITGYVLDEYGNPLPDATVTLWQDGGMWQPNQTLNPGGKNPQPSSADRKDTGAFLFAFLYPGRYTVTAEKYGYTGSASVEISNSTVHTPYSTRILIPDFDAALSPEQASYHGAVTGVVWDRYHTVITRYASVTLWRDGQMVNVTGNPQKRENDTYLFKHLAPGDYMVSADMTDPTGHTYAGNASVYVGTGTANADITLDYLMHVHLIGTPAPSPTPVSGSDALPTPYPGQTMVLLSLIIATAFAGRLRKIR